MPTRATFATSAKRSPCATGASSATFAPRPKASACASWSTARGASRARAGGRDDAAALEAACAAALAARTRRRIARAGRACALAEEEPQRGRFATTVARDFFAVPLADKLALLHAVTDGLRAAAGSRARSASAHVGARRQDKLLATSDGTSVEQLIVHAGGGMKLVVGEGDEVAHRSYPMELDGGVAAGGCEVIERFDFAGNAARIADEAVALLVRAALPCRHDHRHPRHAAAGAADPRVVRPSDRERSRVRRRGLARGRHRSSRPIGSAASATARST